MSANASLTIVGGPTRIEPGRETTLTAEIVNLGTVSDDFRLSVREIDPAWVTFRPPTVFLQPGAQGTAAIVIAPPSGIPAGMLRPIFRLLSRRAGNVAIVEIAMPTARSAAPPPYQPSARQRETRPRPRPQPAPPPAAPPTVAAPPPTVASPPVAETTQPIEAKARVAPTALIGPPAPPTDQRETGERTERKGERATANLSPSRRAISPLVLGLGGGLIALLLLVGVAAALLLGGSGTNNATGGQLGEPTTEPEPTATSPAIAATATVPVIVPAVASRTPTVAFVPKRFVVANTGGEGVYLRRTTNLDDRDIAYVDGTMLTQVGPDVQANGLAWRNVRTPDGKTGYIPAQYTQEAP